GRNRSPLFIVNGVTAPQHGVTNGRKPAGVGRQSPGKVPGTYAGQTACDPSFARKARIAIADASPSAMPASFAGPAGTVASRALYSAVSIASVVGFSKRSTL